MSGTSSESAPGNETTTPSEDAACQETRQSRDAVTNGGYGLRGTDHQTGELDGRRDRLPQPALKLVHEGPVEDLVRKDSQFKKLELVADDYVNDADAVVELLARRKALMQRPVLVRGDLDSDGPLEACVGRPREKLYEFLGA